MDAAFAARCNSASVFKRGAGFGGAADGAAEGECSATEGAAWRDDDADLLMRQL